MNTEKDRRAWEALLVEVAKRGARVLDKDTSFAMKALYYVSFMFLWNPKFLTGYATAGLGRIWIPKAWWGSPEGWTILAHEIVHLDQAKRGLVWHILVYGFPQILAPLGLLGFLGLIWWPLYFLFLLIPLFLAPLFPARGRIDRELEAYVPSVVLTHHVYRSLGYDVREGIAPAYVDALLGGGYFWPAGLFLSRQKLRQQLIDELLRRERDPLSWPPITAVAKQAWR